MDASQSGADVFLLLRKHVACFTESPDCDEVTIPRCMSLRLTDYVEGDEDYGECSSYYVIN